MSQSDDSVKTSASKIIQSALLLQEQPNGHTSFRPEEQCLVAAAYLSEHLPDDDIAADKDWLEETGFNKPVWDYRGMSTKCNEWLIYDAYPSGVTICLSHRSDTFDLLHNPTRGEVRQLLALLVDAQ